MEKDKTKTTNNKAESLDSVEVYIKSSAKEKLEYRKQKFNEIKSYFNSNISKMNGESTKEVDSGKRTSKGGGIRAKKAKLCPLITKKLITLAWQELGQDKNKLYFNAARIVYPINIDYINSIPYPKIRQAIIKDNNKYFYSLPPDLLVYITKDEAPVMYIECKSYTENAMLKRILFDCNVAQRLYKDLSFFLFQLESQLTGDYSELKPECDTIGSHSTRALLSTLPKLKLRIFTYLKGERDMKKPIQDYPKELTTEILQRALDLFKDFFETQIKKLKTQNE